MSWIRITEENISTLKVGMKIQYINANKFEEAELTEFDINNGFITVCTSTGVRGKVYLLYPMYGYGVNVWKFTTIKNKNKITEIILPHVNILSLIHTYRDKYKEDVEINKLLDIFSEYCLKSLENITGIKNK